MVVTLATIAKHIIWTMSHFHFIIVMRPVFLLGMLKKQSMKIYKTTSQIHVSS